MLVVLSTVALAGCQYLFPMYPPIPPGEGFTQPSPAATYTTGHATVKIAGGPTVELPTLASPGTLGGFAGTMVTFKSGDGWYLRVSDIAVGMTPALGGGGFVQLDRIANGQHWTSFSPSGCAVITETADVTALRGHADCKGFRWFDALVVDMAGPNPPFIEGQKPFDATITFEATP